ncbi:MAG: M20 family metallopeptidase [Promethearchaeota archaeon]
MDLEPIFKEVDNLNKDLIMDLMKTVINIDTTIPPGKNYQKFVNKIKPYFKELGYYCEEVIVPEKLIQEIPYPLHGSRVNLVATKEFDENNEWISFYAHMDVVPAPNKGTKKWRFNPFEATIIKSGKIYGRGTSDMKGSIVCLILALQIINKLELKPKYNIRILLCTDEEIGIWPGIRYLEVQGYVKGIVFCMEGVINPIIPVGAAGALNVIVETIGRSCHSGMNFLGVNALEEMVPILDELMILKKIVEARESKNIPGFPRFSTGEKRNMTPMFNLDIIKAGKKSNIVPDLCTLTINRRYIPDENCDNVIKEIKEAIERGRAKSKALDVKTRFIRDYPAVKIDPNSMAIKRLKNVMKLVQNIDEKNILEIGSSGSTDMGFLTDSHDIIIHGVGNPGSNSHGINESIRLKDVKTYIKEIIVYLCAEF